MERISIGDFMNGNYSSRNENTILRSFMRIVIMIVLTFVAYDLIGIGLSIMKNIIVGINAV
ncbi:hypothetical protein PQE75_gp092 [Bacillus phage vB_BcoS-136]|uniref:Uncharacterized protein n=1 Tax=Bacillus phage vB_BcoS-136 TaxID=2419619 RepID=A0A3G3BVH0_9CAUD|nr:hypothetical protein PQE75_gp092 [Bacillus phage vB_BcoS-136]AYP68224.1 hypothetical protein vBBcoS136_00092 [Bacillus phage vB_BcoS-136]